MNRSCSVHPNSHPYLVYVLTFVLAHNTTPEKSIFMLQHKKYLLILVFYLRNAGSCMSFLFVFKYSVQIESYKRFCMKNLTLFTVNGKYTDCTFFKRMNYTN